MPICRHVFRPRGCMRATAKITVSFKTIILQKYLYIYIYFFIKYFQLTKKKKQFNLI